MSVRLNLFERQLVTADCIMRSCIVCTVQRTFQRSKKIWLCETQQFQLIIFDMAVYKYGREKFTWRHRFQGTLLVFCMSRLHVFYTLRCILCVLSTITWELWWNYICEQRCNINNIYLLQLRCYPAAVVILHVNKTWNWLLLNLSREGYMKSM